MAEHFARIRTVLTLLLVTITIGCAVPRRATTQVATAPAPGIGGLESARIAYRAAAADGSTRTTLAIAYPHPDGRPEVALAEVVTTCEKESRPVVGRFARWTRDTLPGVALADGVVEATALEIPAAEVDQLIRSLAEQGYFSSPAAAPVGNQLVVRVNEVERTRPWSQAADLNAIIERVRNDGRLVSMPQVPTAVPAGPENGDRFYEQLAAGEPPVAADLDEAARTRITRLPPVTTGR